VDQRFIDQEVDLEISIGDFVLSGGELAALVILDAVARLTTGVLGNPESINFDSYVDGLLEFPQYTRPQELNVGDGKQNDNRRSIPQVLLSGDHDRINEWRKQKALERTWEKRPDLLAGRNFSSEERKLIKDFIETGQTP
jgi:tRNA (guanine37-N1)-methyltransferase